MQSFAVNSIQGTSRTNNDDRISVVLNMSKDPSRVYDYWPHCFFFGIFDGHNGTGCANFLKGQLAQIHY